jgi:hypothetical protein
MTSDQEADLLSADEAEDAGAWEEAAWVRLCAGGGGDRAAAGLVVRCGRGYGAGPALLVWSPTTVWRPEERWSPARGWERRREGAWAAVPGPDPRARRAVERAAALAVAHVLSS